MRWRPRPDHAHAPSLDGRLKTAKAGRGGHKGDDVPVRGCGWTRHANKPAEWASTGPAHNQVCTHIHTHREDRARARSEALTGGGEGGAGGAQQAGAAWPGSVGLDCGKREQVKRPDWAGRVVRLACGTGFDIDALVSLKRLRSRYGSRHDTIADFEHGVVRPTLPQQAPRSVVRSFRWVFQPPGSIHGLDRSTEPAKLDDRRPVSN